MSARESAVSSKAALPARAAILIVEDEVILAMDLQRTLIELGYDAYAIACSAEAAVKRAQERCPDLVMMDIRIKGGSTESKRPASSKNSSPPRSFTLPPMRTRRWSTARR
jgi:AmiR/NasT family two-component response regulator